MKCSKCNRELQPGDELRWECSSCHQFCRANLQMLEQIQTQRENGYTAAMVNCPFCGTVLDDGNETIHWDCLACGNRMTNTIKNYVRPEMFEEKAEPEQEDSANQSEFAWFDSNGEAMDAPPEEPPAKQKSFFANEDEKKEFLAETKSQALGEEIPDSIFDDVPIRKPRNTAAESSGQKTTPTSGASGASPFVESPTEPTQPMSSTVSPATASTGGNQTASVSSGVGVAGNGSVNAVPSGAASVGGTQTSTVPSGATSVGGTQTNTVPSGAASVGGTQTNTVSPGAASVGGTQTNAVSSGINPSGSAPKGAAPKGNTSGASPFLEPPTGPAKTTSSTVSPTTASTRSSQTGSASSGVSAAGSSSINSTSSSLGSTARGGGGRSTTASGNMNVSSSGSSASDSSTPDFSHYEPPKPQSKQILPKILTGILSVLIVAAIAVGGFFAVRFYMAPTRQFRSAVQKADYAKALEIYDNKIKGDTEEEKIARIAVEHFLHERYEVYKNGGDENAYRQILEFAQNEMGMNTSDYELSSEPEETPEPTETPEPSESPAVEETEAPSETETPEETPEPTPEETVAPEETPEPTPEATEPPEEPAIDPQPAGTEDEITAAIQKANKYVKKKKYEKAYNHLAGFKDADTTGQIKKEMSSIKKEWKSYNITTFKTLCSKLSIVYYASEKQYHIVPKGYYTNYNQISRSNNVGGIAYMDQQKKKVSITNIGKDGALSSFGKTNRANLKQFKEMIEKYPYLAKEIK